MKFGIKIGTVLLAATALMLAGCDGGASGSKDNSNLFSGDQAGNNGSATTTGGQCLKVCPASDGSYLVGDPTGPDGNRQNPSGSANTTPDSDNGASGAPTDSAGNTPQDPSNTFGDTPDSDDGAANGGSYAGQSGAADSNDSDNSTDPGGTTTGPDGDGLIGPPIEADGCVTYCAPDPSCNLVCSATAEATTNAAGQSGSDDAAVQGQPSCYWDCPQPQPTCDNANGQCCDATTDDNLVGVCCTGNDAGGSDCQPGGGTSTDPTDPPEDPANGGSGANEPTDNASGA